MLCVLTVKGREKSGNCIAGSDKSKKEKKEQKKFDQKRKLIETKRRLMIDRGRHALQKRASEWTPIDLREDPYKKIIQDLKVAHLYNRGRVPQWMYDQYPDGFRIQDVFDMSTINTNGTGWENYSGGVLAPTYKFRNKDFTIDLHSVSFKLGDVIIKNMEINIVDNSDYFATHKICTINYYSSGKNLWLAASKFLNTY